MEIKININSCFECPYYKNTQNGRQCTAGYYGKDPEGKLIPDGCPLKNTSSNSDYAPCIMCRGCQHECKTGGNIAECNDYLPKHGAYSQNDV